MTLTVWLAHLRDGRQDALKHIVPWSTKNCDAWREGESFGSKAEFLDKVARIIKFQEEEAHRPTATIETCHDGAHRTLRGVASEHSCR
jgi:hypothetical protein